MKATSSRLVVGSPREMSAVGVVCALSAGYAAAVLGASDVLNTYAHNEGGAAGVLSGVVSIVFVLIALFVSAIVIANGVDAVITGRAPALALLRLVGASSAQLRGSVTRAVAIVAVVGAVTGAIVGTAGVAATRILLVHSHTLPTAHYRVMAPQTPVAVVVVVGCAVMAGMVGAQRALGGPAATNTLQARRPVVVGIVGSVLTVAGVMVLVLACLLGERASLAGFGVAFLGSAITSLGVLAGARVFVPRMVAVCGLLAGRSASARVARKNAVSDPLRTTRSTLGLLIGVTLVTTIAAGMSSLTRAVHSWQGLTPQQQADAARNLSVAGSVLIALVAISAVIAAVGFVSTMSLTVSRRTREIGMLRAMGFTARQIRSMIVTESLALSGAAIVIGLVLGIAFGSVATQSLVGAVTSGLPIGLPWPAVLAIVVGAALVVLLASVPPSRRAVSVSPVDALAIV